MTIIIIFVSMKMLKSPDTMTIMIYQAVKLSDFFF